MESRTHLAIGIMFSLIGVLIFWGSHDLKMFDMILWVGIFSMLPNVDRTVLRRSERTFTHSLVFAAAVFLALYAVPSVFEVGKGYVSNLVGLEGATYAALGVVSHIFADSLTTSGVPVLSPLVHVKHYHLPFIGPRLRYPDNYMNNYLQVIAIVVFISLLLVDLLGYFA